MFKYYISSFCVSRFSCIKDRKLVLISLLLLLLSQMILTTKAFATNSNNADLESIKARFHYVGLKVLGVTPSQMPNLFEVQTDQGLFFSSNDGEYFIQGKLYSISDDGKFSDVLTQRYAKEVEQFADQMIVYPAENEKYVVNVFTDTTCTYCLKLHSKIDEYNQLGITVRYLAFPRQGPVSPVGVQMAQIWCADDKAKALDLARKNEDFEFNKENMSQCQKEVLSQYNYGQKVGITGTPAILTSTGQLLSGYMPPQQLQMTLEQNAS